MNKFFTTLLVVLTFSATVFSQTKGTNQFAVHIGYNAATATSQYATADYLGGFNAGVYLDHYFSDKWSLKTGLNYDQKGWANGYYDDVSSFTVTDYRLNYITIPVMANWHFGKTKNWYLNFGPYIGFLLDASTREGQDVKSYFNSTDGGLDIGIGVKFPVSNTTRLFIEVNGQAGFSDLSNATNGSNVRNSVTGFNIGLAF
ncbi:PorT family protein [Inquilinus sp. KBS0705]|nr:PorT family protein [Inquilinus sp. KBS0705]